MVVDVVDVVDVVHLVVGGDLCSFDFVSGLCSVEKLVLGRRKG